MNTTLENTTESHSLTQARAQVSSILEMVRALDIETAAADFVATLERNDLEVILRDASIGVSPSGLSDEDLSETVSGIIARGDVEPKGWNYDEDEARQAIQEDALSVEYRSGWATPGAELEPEEFMILLCTGGPAVRLVGDINQHGEPENVRVEHQDWGTPWMEYTGTSREEDDALLTYCREYVIPC